MEVVASYLLPRGIIMTIDDVNTAIQCARSIAALVREAPIVYRWARGQTGRYGTMSRMAKRRGSSRRSVSAPGSRWNFWTISGASAIAAVLVFVAAAFAVSISRPSPNVAGPAYIPPTAAERGTPEAEQFTRPTDRPLRLLVAGDSLSNGTFADNADLGYNNLTQREFRRNGPVEPQRAGNAGEIAAQSLDDLDTVVGPLDVAIVELGTNDVILNSPENFAREYPELIQKITAASPDVTLVCIGPWGTAADAKPFATVIKKTCEEADGRYIGVSDLFENEANRGPKDSVTLAGAVRDDFHPNNPGHQRIAQRVTAAFGLGAPQVAG